MNPRPQRSGGIVMMAREEIMALSGRELDVAVAEHVMGWKRGNVDHGDMPWYRPVDGGMRGTPAMPRFSTDISSALDVVTTESKHRPDEEFLLIRLRDGRWLAGWFDGYLDPTGVIDGHIGGGYAGHDSASAIDESPAAASCRASLLSAMRRIRSSEKNGGAEREWVDG